MAQIANVEYFAKKCNQVLGTSYTWNSKQAINVKWLCTMVVRVFEALHSPKADCHIHLTEKLYQARDLTSDSYLIAVDKSLVDLLIDYISWVPRACDTDCACPCVNNTTPTETCTTCVTCNECNTCVTATCIPNYNLENSTCITCLQCSTCTMLTCNMGPCIVVNCNFV
jgi:hypothetical protein